MIRNPKKRASKKAARHEAQAFGVFETAIAGLNEANRIREAQAQAAYDLADHYDALAAQAEERAEAHESAIVTNEEAISRLAAFVTGAGA